MQGLHSPYTCWKLISAMSQFWPVHPIAHLTWQAWTLYGCLVYACSVELLFLCLPFLAVIDRHVSCSGVLTKAHIFTDCLVLWTRRYFGNYMQGWAFVVSNSSQQVAKDRDFATVLHYVHNIGQFVPRACTKAAYMVGVNYQPLLQIFQLFSPLIYLVMNKLIHKGDFPSVHFVQKW